MDKTNLAKIQQLIKSYGCRTDLKKLKKKCKQILYNVKNFINGFTLFETVEKVANKMKKKKI